MFDVIGKRRWFYALSALLTIPGLIFILISPFSDAGLQLTIDFTGGTRWEIKFEDPAVTPEQVEAVFAENDLDAVAIRTGTGFIEIKTEPIGLQVEPVATPSASPSGSANPSASPGPSQPRRPRGRLDRRPASISRRLSASAGGLGIAGRLGIPVRVAGRRPGGQHPAADRRQARGDGDRPRA